MGGFFRELYKNNHDDLQKNWRFWASRPPSFVKLQKQLICIICSQGFATFRLFNVSWNVPSVTVAGRSSRWNGPFLNSSCSLTDFVISPLLQKKKWRWHTEAEQNSFYTVHRIFLWYYSCSENMGKGRTYCCIIWHERSRDLFVIFVMHCVFWGRKEEKTFLSPQNGGSLHQQTYWNMFYTYFLKVKVEGVNCHYYALSVYTWLITTLQMDPRAIRLLQREKNMHRYICWCICRKCLVGGRYRRMTRIWSNIRLAFCDKYAWKLHDNTHDSTTTTINTKTRPWLVQCDGSFAKGAKHGSKRFSVSV